MHKSFITDAIDHPEAPGRGGQAAPSALVGLVFDQGERIEIAEQVGPTPACDWEPVVDQAGPPAASSAIAKPTRRWWRRHQGSSVPQVGMPGPVHLEVGGLGLDGLLQGLRASHGAAEGEANDIAIGGVVVESSLWRGGRDQQLDRLDRPGLPGLRLPHADGLALERLGLDPRADDLLGGETQERVAVPQGVVKERKWQARRGRDQPERRLGQVNGEWVLVDSVDTVPSDEQPADPEQPLVVVLAPDSLQLVGQARQFEQVVLGRFGVDAV